MALRNLGTALSRLSLTTITRGGSASGLQHLDYISSLPFASTTTTCSISSSMGASTTMSSSCVTSSVVSNPLTLAPQVRKLATSAARPASLRQMHRSGPVKKIRKNKNPLINKPYARGVVLKTLIKKPKKPNSANRKCVLVRLTTGREMIAYVPGEGHNLQEHNIVLVRPGRLQDVPGVKLKCVRGKYDLQHVIKKSHWLCRFWWAPLRRDNKWVCDLYASISFKKRTRILIAVVISNRLLGWEENSCDTNTNLFLLFKRE